MIACFDLSAHLSPVDCVAMLGKFFFAIAESALSEVELASLQLNSFILAGGGDRLASALGLSTLKAMLSFTMLDTNDKTK
jgi:hypothetical protein